MLPRSLEHIPHAFDASLVFHGVDFQYPVLGPGHVVDPVGEIYRAYVGIDAFIVLEYPRLSHRKFSQSLELIGRFLSVAAFPKQLV